jgi:ectoine hydroxylase-related dioxygenase (phytanoyl-CoA dioxygenase family)
MNLKSKVAQLNSTGSCVLEKVFDASECAKMRAILGGYYQRLGSPELKEFGIGIHPLIPRMPEFKAWLMHPLIFDVLTMLLGEPAKLLHGGARLSDGKSAKAIGWHNHYSWDESKIPARQRCERILCGIYVDGSTRESGPLTVMPRKYNDPLGPPPENFDGFIPGEAAVDAPPGSVVVFDTALWHRAHRGTEPGMRHLFGGHYQAVTDMRPHPEDNDVAVTHFSPSTPFSFSSSS